MSKVCESCGRGSGKATSRSHANNKTLRRQYVNLQTKGGAKVCTKCIKTSAKKKVK